MADNTIAISSPTITANNQALEIVPNTCTYTEGFGEYTQRVASAGGGSTNIVFSENAEMKKSKLTFEVYATAEMIGILRSLKNNRQQNVFTVESSELTRTIRQAAIISDYEVALGADTTIPLEVEGRSAV